MNPAHPIRLSRRNASLLAAASLLLAPVFALAASPDMEAIEAKVIERHDESVKRLQEWIALPSIAAEDLNAREGAQYMARLARDAGFQKVEILETDGKPGVFAMLDAGAEKTVGLYFMYDVKQFDPSEWSSPPLEARLVEKPGLGTVMMGRGATNQKGPQLAFLAALHAIRDANQAMPVNLVLIAEGEEEIGSPNIKQIVYRPEVQAALRGAVGVFMPFPMQDSDGAVSINLGAKGLVELELVASGEKWGRGPLKDVHSSLKAMVDSPAWRLVKALDTLVSDDGNTITIDGYPTPPPLTGEQRAMIAKAMERRSEATAKKQLGVSRWIDDLSWQEANERLVSQPTVNIQGLVSGYMGPGGKTILPGRAEAKIDLRLVPDMTKDDAVAKLKAHLAKRGFGDIEVNVSGGYGPTQTDENSLLVKAEQATLASAGIPMTMSARSAGSWPGVVFTGPPLKMAAGQFGSGRGGGAHAPDEWLLIDSSNPKVAGFDGQALLFADFLYEVARAAKAKQ